MNNIELALEMWKALVPHLIAGDVSVAADDFVHVLVENGFDPSELTEYGIDSAIRSALREYLDDEHDDDEVDDGDELYFE